MKKEKPKIAILGWGSLLWEPGGDFGKWIEPWQYDGPELEIEFSRISESRQGALTLVIDAEHGVPTTVAWCLSKREKLDDAIADLRAREGTTKENIGYIRIDQQPLEAKEAMVVWAREKNFDAVVWTALKSNFQEKVKEQFSVTAVVAYVETLPPAGKAKAAEYVWRAPEFVQTAVRSALQKQPWFSTPD